MQLEFVQSWVVEYAVKHIRLLIIMRRKHDVVNNVFEDLVEISSVTEMNYEAVLHLPHDHGPSHPP